MSRGAAPIPRRASPEARSTDAADALRESARASGLEPGDPLSPLVEGLAGGIEHLDERHDMLVAATAETVDTLRIVLAEGRETAEAEASRFRAECQATEAETVRSLSTVLADTAERALTHRVRALDRRTAALVGLGVAGALALGMGGGWWAGDRSARANITATEDGLRAAFRHGPETARLWLDLMSWNDARVAVVRCRDSGQIREESGRKVCNLLLWVSAPPAVPPP